MYARFPTSDIQLTGRTADVAFCDDCGIATELPAGWTCEVLTDVGQILGIAREWLNLEATDNYPHSVFQSYAWCLSWVESFCTSEHNCPVPQIYLLRHNGLLRAVFPMMLEKNRFVSVLTMLGEPHSQLAGLIVDHKQCPDYVLSAFVGSLQNNNKADVVAIGPVPEGSALNKALSNHKLRADPAKYISTVIWDPGFHSSDYLDRISKNRRKDLQKKQKRLEKMGPISFDVVGCGSEKFHSLISMALEWKRSWLRDNSIVSVGLSNPKLEQFLTNINLANDGFSTKIYPEIEVLSVGDKEIAISISMVGNGFRHCYLSSYDPLFSEVSPGTLVHQFAIQHSIKKQMNGYSFLGFPTHFKSMWSNQEIALNRYIRGNSVRGNLWVHVWALFLRPLAKLLLNKTRLSSLNRLINNILSKS